MKVFFVSLGCDKNLVDSEHMLAVLSKNGAVITSDEREADVAVINTCSFIADAKEESIDTIIEMGDLKRTGSLKALIVTGCLAQRYAGEIRESLPEVDAVLGVDDIEKIYDAAAKALEGEKPDLVSEPGKLCKLPAGRLVTTGGHYAYLKIAEGCNKRCTYCAIPSFRGRYRSYPMEDLIEEARALALGGARELILVAQETTLYGTDIYGKKSLCGLIKRLSEINGIEWIRLLYCYPEEIDGDFADMMARNDKVCHYVDMPVQHCSDDILRRMGRRTTKDDLIKKISLLRDRVPDICIRTTMIAGFPGETKKEHLEALDFIRKMKFDRLGVFPYSREEGTPAAGFKKQVPARVKERRARELMELQQDIVFEMNLSFSGRTMKAFVEGYLPEDDIYIARTYRDAPGVDGLVFIDSGRQLMSGELVDVRITGAKGYDLTASLI